MTMRLWALLAGALALLPAPSPACAQTSSHQGVKSVALVVGQSKYQHTPPLPNAFNDATAIASTLKDLGFDVVASIDGGREGIEAATAAFIEKARKTDVSMFYYAGHAIQVRGSNYVVPIDAKASPGIDIEREFVSLSQILEKLEAAAPPQAAKLIVLDACRDSFRNREGPAELEEWEYDTKAYLAFQKKAERESFSDKVLAEGKALFGKPLQYCWPHDVFQPCDLEQAARHATALPSRGLRVYGRLRPAGKLAAFASTVA